MARNVADAVGARHLQADWGDAPQGDGGTRTQGPAARGGGAPGLERGRGRVHCGTLLPAIAEGWRALCPRASAGRSLRARSNLEAPDPRKIEAALRDAH